MGKFNRGGAGFGGKWGGDRGSNRFEGRSENRDGGRGRRDWGGQKEMHQAICAKCGKTCEVPFRPSNDKPVYCNNCFVSKDGGRSDRSSRRDNGRNFGSKNSFGGSQSGNSEILTMLKELSVKIDTLTSAVGNISGTKNIDKKEVSKKETKTKEKVSKIAKKAKAVVKKVAKTTK